MAIKKNELYSSLWASCDKLRGGMDASQYKDYILTLLFVKYGHLDDSAKIELGETMTELLRRNKDTEEQTNEAGRNHKGAAL